MDLNRLDEKLDRIELKLERTATILEAHIATSQEHKKRMNPMLEDFLATKALKTKLKNTLKFVALIVGLVLSSYSLIDKIGDRARESDDPPRMVNDK